MKTKQVFISYATEDAQFAHRLADDLQRLGVQVWIASDSIRPGEGWVEAIERGLAESSHIVVVLTPAALESEWVRKETDVAIAQERKGRIQVIPLDVEPCEVPLLLSSYQMVSFRRDYDAGLSQLANILGLRVVEPPEEIRKLEEEESQKPAKSVVELLRKVVAQPGISRYLIGAGVVVALAVVAVFAVSKFFPELQPTPTRIAEAMPTSRTTEVTVVAPTATPTPSRTLPPTNTPWPVPPTDTPLPPPATPAPIPTMDIASVQATQTVVSAPEGMVLVPAGEFIMGSPEGEGSADERPQHTVYVSEFWIDKTEATNAQYRKCVEAGTCRAPTTCDFAGSTYSDSSKADHPVGCVSWQDAKTYCEWAGKRLPTEAEWEKAARGTDGRKYPWGDGFDGSKVNFCDANCGWNHEDSNADDGYGGTAPAGSYPEGASPYGALDMAGNVWEWCQDWYDEDYYASSPQHDPEGPSSGSHRVVRGGSWFSVERFVRAAYRYSYNFAPDARFNYIGFRCVSRSPVEHDTPTPTPTAAPTLTPEPPTPTKASPTVTRSPTDTPTSTPTATIPSQSISVPDAVVREFFSPGPSPAALAVAGDTLWVADEQQQLVYQLDRAGVPLASFPITPTGTIHGLAWDGEALRLASGRQVVRLDTDGTVLASFSLPFEPTGLSWDPADATLWTALAHRGFLLEFSADGIPLQILHAPISPPWLHGFVWAPDCLWVVDGWHRWYCLGLGGEKLRSAYLPIEADVSETALTWDERGYLWVTARNEPQIYQLSLRQVELQLTPTATPGKDAKLALPRPQLKPASKPDKVIVHVTNNLQGTLSLSFGGESAILKPSDTWSAELSEGFYTIFVSASVPEPIAFSDMVLLMSGYEWTWVLSRPE